MKQHLLLLLITLNLMVDAQQEEFLNVRNAISPEPTAASLGKYGDIPVGLFTGVPQISIPLYNIQEGNLSLPLSISYHSSGFKVEDIASNVGLGWSLNAGGVITRAVKGVPDDFHGDLWGRYFSGIMYNGVPVYWPTASWGFLTTGLTGNSPSVFGTEETITDNIIDSEPDIFYFNFAGISGEFILDANGIPKIFSKNNLKISYTRNANNDLVSFKIVDGNGNIYTFDRYDETKIKNKSYTEWEQIQMYGGFANYDKYFSEAVESDYSLMLPDGGHDISIFNSSWYLTKVQNANLTLEINLVYEYEKQYNVTGFSQQFTYGSNSYQNSFSISNVENTILSNRIKEITYGDFKIDFAYTHSRQDLGYGGGGYNAPSALTDINIYNKNISNSYVLLKKYNLVYSYLNGATQIAHYSKKLMLNSLTEKDANGIAKPSHVFEYNTSVPVIPRSSYAKDFFGFQKSIVPVYNGSKIPKIFIDATSGKPDFNTFGSIYSVFQGSQNQCTTKGDYDLSPEVAGQTAFLLQKIIYPTGGSTSFEFEPHQFTLFNINRIGGGARIKKITDYDGADHSKDIIKNYSYVQEANPLLSSGVVMTLPTLAKKIEACGVSDHCTIFTSNIGSLGSTNGSLVGYSRVTVEHNGNGKTVSLFNTQGNINSMTEECDINNNCIYKKTMATGSCQDDNYPFADNPNFDWYRGVLLEEQIFNNTNQLIKKTVNEYTVKNHAKVDVQKWGLYGKNFLSGDKEYKSASYYYLSGWKVLSKQTTTDYDVLNAGRQLQTITNYFYDNADHLQLTKTTTTNSKGQTFESVYKRSKDYPGAAGMITALNTQNRLNEVIESQTWLQGSPKKLLGASFNSYFDYKTQNGLSNPQNLIQQQFQLETAAPLVQTSFATTWFDDGAAVLDPKYKPTSIFNYDNKDNLTRQSVINGDKQNHTANIFGHSKKLVIAQVNNATEADCGFTSFESDDQNLWAMGGTIVLNTTDAHSGTSCRTIPANTFGPTRNYMPSNDFQNSKFILSCWVKTNSNLAGAVGSLVLTSVQNISSGSTYPNVAGSYVSTSISNTNNIWKYIEVEIDLKQIKANGAIPNTALAVRSFVWNTHASISIQVDDIRFYPKQARMASYTHIPLIGVSSISDENSNCQYYEYDSFGRLKIVKDQNGKILEKTDYNYKP
jgi:hypothetical protein